MNRSTGALLLMLGGALFAQEIHFKTRSFQVAPQTDTGFDSAASAGKDNSAIHKIIQFDHAPGQEDLDALMQDGLQVVGAMPDNALVVAAAGGQIPDRPGRRWIGRLEAADKMSRGFAGADVDPVLALPVLALVEFHSDVTPGQQDVVAAAEGLALQRPKVLRPDHAIVTSTLDALQALSAHDEVAYIFPADPGLLTGDGLMPCVGMLTSSGPVGQYANIVHGWDLDADHIAHLGYAFGSITPKVPASVVESEVVRALNEWTKYTNIIFQPAAGPTSARSVLVKFVSGSHGDAWPFDGPGGVLAHTFYPVPVNSEPIAGDMHLDADENWHAGGDLDIYSVALHEAGHAIGLSHSDTVGDVMYPYYRSHLALSANDIGAAQVLYGAPTPTPAPVANPIAPPHSNAPPAPPVVPVTPPLSVLRLVLDASASSTQSPSAMLTGTLSGGATPYTVQWQTDHGYSGRATIAGKAWTASGIALVNGVNTLTVTAFDAAGRTASQTVSTTLTPSEPPPSAGSGPPISISIHSPSSSVSTVNASVLTVSGSASGGGGVARVTWQTAAGATGNAAGTDKWLAQGIPLLTGTNTVIVRAWDAKGANAWAAVVVVRH